MATTSTDRGAHMVSKYPLTEATHGIGYYNCPRITTLSDGRLVVIVDKIYATGEDRDPDCYRNLLIFSDDGGVTWSEAVETPARGIVPDRLLELADRRWLLSCRTTEPASRNLVQRLWYSDDQGATWTGPVIVRTATRAQPLRGLDPTRRGSDARRIPPGELREGLGLLQDDLLRQRSWSADCVSAGVPPTRGRMGSVRGW